MTTPPSHKELNADDARILDMIAEHGFDDSMLEKMNDSDRTSIHRCTSPGKAGES